jgi:hypothetical protein
MNSTRKTNPFGVTAVKDTSKRLFKMDSVAKALSETKDTKQACPVEKPNDLLKRIKTQLVNAAFVAGLVGCVAAPFWAINEIYRAEVRSFNSDPELVNPQLMRDKVRQIKKELAPLPYAPNPPPLETQKELLAERDRLDLKIRMLKGGSYPGGGPAAMFVTMWGVAFATLGGTILKDARSKWAADNLKESPKQVISDTTQAIYAALSKKKDLTPEELAVRDAEILRLVEILFVQMDEDNFAIALRAAAPDRENQTGLVTQRYLIVPSYIEASLERMEPRVLLNEWPAGIPRFEFEVKYDPTHDEVSGSLVLVPPTDLGIPEVLFSSSVFQPKPADSPGLSSLQVQSALLNVSTLPAENFKELVQVMLSNHTRLMTAQMAVFRNEQRIQMGLQPKADDLLRAAKALPPGKGLPLEFPLTGGMNVTEPVEMPIRSPEENK